VKPESVETKIASDPAANLLPSAEQVTEAHWRDGALLKVQCIPKSRERKIDVSEAATKVLPSAELATQFQQAKGAVVWSHVCPESLDT
jgi:hypothetical protein